MYSGTTFRVKSGRVMGVHQRIDRLAHRAIVPRIPGNLAFPTVKEIIHFEGLNGPDGIKRKSPSVDEPWHHINPLDSNDTGIVRLIDDHIHNLAAALRASDMTRAAFEAAWMAHAITDGLTPAHHDGLGDKIEALWGKAHHLRDSVRDKTLIRGTNRRDTIRKNWEYWGKGGIFTAHILFEWGVATTIAPLRFDGVGPNGNDVIRLEQHGFTELFYESLRKIVNMKMYEEFARTGWNRHLANETRVVLIPEIVKVVTLGWHEAILLAQTEGDKT